jgi:SAM-dependent methyltransferase
VKLRGSGMPSEELWETLLNAEQILDSLGVGPQLGDVVELGCGYGTFTIPTAPRVSGVVRTFDIEPEMTGRTAERAAAAKLGNVVCQLRDVMADGFGLPERSADAVYLFNILHCESPEVLLDEAAGVVREGGHVLVIHWRHDASTPRGPDLSIRPKPEQIIQWSQATGRLDLEGQTIDLPPWHYGLKFVRTA